jgi:hypothetical protein
MCVFPYVCVYVYICIYTCMKDTYTIYIYILYTHTRTHIHTFFCACTCMYVSVRRCVHMHACIHICAHNWAAWCKIVHAATHTHTHSHIYACVHSQLSCMMQGYAPSYTHTHIYALTIELHDARLCTQLQTHTHICTHNLAAWCKVMHPATHTHTHTHTYTHSQLSCMMQGRHSICIQRAYFGLECNQRQNARCLAAHARLYVCACMYVYIHTCMRT